MAIDNMANQKKFMKLFEQQRQLAQEFKQTPLQFVTDYMWGTTFNPRQFDYYATFPQEKVNTKAQELAQFTNNYLYNPDVTYRQELIDPRLLLLL